jgi:hypothetical protein
MSDQGPKRTRGVPWGDNTEPASSNLENPADRSARIDPEELDDREVSPGGLAASSPATPRGDAPEEEAPRERDSRPVRDVGAGSLKAEHKPD